MALALVAATIAPALACSGGTDLVGRLRDEEPARFAAFEAAGRKTPNAEGLLWRLSKDGRAESHLFGTIHLSDPRLAPLPAEALDAISNARLVLVEPRDSADPDEAGKALKLASQMAFRPQGRTLGLLPPQDRVAVMNLMAARGVPEMAARRLEPWFLAMLATTPTCEIARVDTGALNVDRMVIEAARAAGRRVSGLEDADEQMETLAAVPPELAARVLIDTARLGPGFSDFIETVINLYRDRRIGFLSAALRDLDLGGPRMRTELDYFEAVLAGRNERMEQRSRDALDQGGVFVAVGAMHLPGPDGLVERFRALGFTVESVL